MESTKRAIVELDDGTRIMVKASAKGGEEDVAEIDRILSFTNVTATIEGLAKTLNTAIAKVKPTKASVEFGIELGVESGQLTALVAQGSATTNLKITLEWGK